MKTQWHPPFVNLMTLALGDYYTVEHELPVSDLPRQADLVLIRRDKDADPPFDGIWMHLRPWNLFEFKGPTDDAEDADLELLMHVGTGVLVKFNEDRKAQTKEQREGPIPAGEFALWFLAPRLGETFLNGGRRRAGFEPQGGGLWEAKLPAWGHPAFLVDYGQLDLRQPDSLPLAVLRRDLGNSAVVRDLLLSRVDLLRRFAPSLFEYQPRLWEVLKAMAQPNDIIDWKEVARVATPDMDKLLPHFPTEGLIAAVGEDKLIKAVGQEKFIQTFGEADILRTLLEGKTPEQITELLHRFGPGER